MTVPGIKIQRNEENSDECKAVKMQTESSTVQR
jgi:hypothetical protein